MIPHDHNDDDIDDANDDGDNCHRVQNCAILIYEFIST
jgi:hypothetical protein